MKFTQELYFKVFSDDDGYYWRVGFDADGLGCVSVTYSDGEEDSKETECFTVPPEAARALADAMCKVADAIEKQQP